MKLVQKIEKNELLSKDWGIYELNAEEKQKYGGNFALSQGVFSDYALENFGADHLLRKLDDICMKGSLKHKKKPIYRLN